ncbi:MAG: hypothetical protein RL308_108 [Bacteroidota bacterium]|jgi:hypothetical protein
MSFLYDEYISEIENCPTEIYNEVNISECFRWVFDDMNNSDNFLPPAIRSRKFANNASHIMSQKCGDYAPSFHKTFVGSLKHYGTLMVNFSVEMKQKRLGTHIAIGKIEILDGKCSNPCKKYTHFDLHIYEGNKLKENFEILQKIE